MTILILEDNPDFFRTVFGYLQDAIPEELRRTTTILHAGADSQSQRIAFPPSHVFPRKNTIEFRGCQYSLDTSVDTPCKSGGQFSIAPSDLDGAILDVVIRSRLSDGALGSGSKVGLSVANWLADSGFAGPVFLYSGEHLPLSLPRLGMLLTANKDYGFRNGAPESLKAFGRLLTDQARGFGRLYNCNASGIADGRGVPHGGAAYLASRALLKNSDVLEILHRTIGRPALKSTDKIKFHVCDVTTTVGDGKRFALEGRVSVLLRESIENGPDPDEAMKHGCIYADIGQMNLSFLRYSMATAEEIAGRFVELRNLAKSTQTTRYMSHVYALHLTRFAQAYFRGLLFSTASKDFHASDGWLHQMAWLPANFEKQSKVLLRSAIASNLVPPCLKKHAENDKKRPKKTVQVGSGKKA